MKKLLTIFSFFTLITFAQQDSIRLPDIKEYEQMQQRNALPPGPARITGTLVNKKGEPVNDVLVTVKYPDGKQRDADTFKTNPDGIFQVYVFRNDQAYIDLKIIRGRKILKRIRYCAPSPGTNIGHPSNKIVIQ
jgi:hypothetical protein